MLGSPGVMVTIDSNTHNISTFIATRGIYDSRDQIFFFCVSRTIDVEFWLNNFNTLYMTNFQS